MFERILVPLDGSQVAEMVIPYAVELASLFNSSIVIVGVSDSSGWQAVVECRSYLENQSHKIKDGLQKRQPEDEGTSPHSQVNYRCLIGNPASEILNHAGKIGSSLIILASRGASGGGTWPLGNIADKVLRASNCPVLLVREHLDDAAIALKYIIRKILVPLDGSDLSEAVLPPASGLAKVLGAEMVLFQVVEPIPFATYSRLTPEIIQQFKLDLHALALEYLNRTRDALTDMVPAVSVATGTPPVADKIIDYSETNHCDLIAISTNGRSGISRWVFGSVTEKILHAGKKPVLVVRPKQ